ncbi:MAG: type II secretion system F family protein [Planctomycetes bacterium]|nr:type II secretion system F family protein [Planctomycetota bacterium]
MSTFKYAAKGPGGKTVEGTIDAADRNEAVAELRKQNLVVMRVEQSGSANKAPRAPGGKLSFFQAGPSASKNELVLFTRQLSTMVGAGLALLESLDVLHDQAESPGMKKATGILVNEVRSGVDLSAAMEKCPKAFDPLYVSMVRAGEVSGQMDVILERLADYQEASEHLRREIRSAMTYPCISMVLVLGITAFLMLGVVPGFRAVFDSMDAELPGITQFTLNTAEFMKTHWAVCFGGFFGTLAAAFMYSRTESGGWFFDRFSLKVPVFGSLIRKVCLARFSRTFATLIRSGVPIMATLDIVAETAGNRVVAKAVLDSRESVRAGNLLSEPLMQAPVFPPMVVRMIAIGERTGSLETLLEKIAEFYDAQVKAAVKSLTSMIEPILITVMGVIVGGVVMSVFLPILDIVGKLGGQGGG